MDAATEEGLSSDVEGSEVSDRLDGEDAFGSVPDTDGRDADPGEDADAGVDLTDGGEPLDGGDEVPNDRADGGWNPLALSGLALWLDAGIGAKLSQGRLALWQDQSGNGNSAAQSSRYIQPLWINDGIGAHAGVLFEGNGEFLDIADSASMRFGERDFAVHVVMRHHTPTNHSVCPTTYYYGMVFHKQSNAYPYPGFAIVANSADGSPSLRGQVEYVTGVEATPFSPDTGYNDDGPRVIGIYRRGDILSLRINGVLAGTIAIPLRNGIRVNVDALGEDATIGAASDGIQCLDGVISEIVAASTVTEDDVTTLEAYLLRKYSDVVGVTPRGP